MGLGDWLQATLGFLGPAGILAAMFLIFFVDAVVFPALPEVFVVLFYFQLADVSQWAWNPFVAAGALLLLAVLGDVCGNASLYTVVRWFNRRGRVPRRLARFMQQWTKFLVTSDERVLLVNRVAPAVPFTGAFIAVCGWSIGKSLAFIAIGGAAKYGVLLGLVAGLGVAFDREAAQWITLAAVAVLIVVSVAAGQVRKRRMQARGVA